MEVRDFLGFTKSPEYKLLTRMWKPRIRRSTNLIVPKVTHLNRKESLHNEHWAFHVPYAFRSALDIRYDERKKDKKPYMVWTQGPCLRFKAGDMLVPRSGNFSYQVQEAEDMSWDDVKGEMYLGVVTFAHFGSKGIDRRFPLTTCNQMDFLGLLIYGGN